MKKEDTIEDKIKQIEDSILNIGSRVGEFRARVDSLYLDMEYLRTYAAVMATRLDALENPKFDNFLKKYQELRKSLQGQGQG